MVSRPFISFAITLMLALSASADTRVNLGERTVGDLGDRDTIVVGVKKGRFSGMQVHVSKAAVQFKRVVIHFENGEEQVFSRDRLLRKGQTSRVIDFNGDSRFIDKVVFHYEARSRGWKVARITLFGVR